MEQFLTILYPYWFPFVCFSLGFFVGLIFERVILKGNVFPTHLPRVFVSAVIFGLWAASMSIDIFTGVQNTPWVLHAFMGAVIGAMNHEFGDYLLKLLGRNLK